MAITMSDIPLTMISDGETLAFKGMDEKTNFSAKGFFISSMSLNQRRCAMDVTTFGDSDRLQYIQGPTSVDMDLSIKFTGPITFTEGGLINNVFDLFSVRELLIAAEKKFNKRKL